MKKIISEHILEIRYKPNPRFLDRRGEIADVLPGSRFDRWNITNNRIDFANKKNPNIGAFFSYRNLGFFTTYPVKANFFKNNAKDFLRSAWTYFPTDKITRVGVRSTFLVEVKNFKDAFDKYRDRFLKLDNKEIEQFGGDLIDLGFPLDFAVEEDFFNITTGPMKKQQSKQFLMDIEGLPGTGIYVDVDYFRKEFSPHVTQKNILELIDRGIQKAEDIKEKISEWIIK